jgi:uncharacterized protein (DUF488 family)
MPEPRTLYTIGYEGASRDQFAKDLAAAGVTTLVDVRRRAMSRKPGFAKKALTADLAEAGISYVHIPDLGAPLDIFYMKDKADHTPMLIEYEKRLPGEVVALDELTEIIQQQTACLMCFEKDPARCHRSVLTRFLAQRMTLDVVDL